MEAERCKARSWTPLLARAQRAAEAEARAGCSAVLQSHSPYVEERSVAAGRLVTRERRWREEGERRETDHGQGGSKSWRRGSGDRSSSAWLWR